MTNCIFITIIITITIYYYCDLRLSVTHHLSLLRKKKEKIRQKKETKIVNRFSTESVSFVLLLSNVDFLSLIYPRGERQKRNQEANEKQKKKNEHMDVRRL